MTDHFGRRCAGAFATASALGLGLAGCGGSSSSGSGAAAPASGGPSSAGSGSGGTGSSVSAVETEYHIALSRTSFTAGRYTFVDSNHGQVTHALEIDGPGVSHRSTGDVEPGTSSSMTVTLSAGSYEVYCPVGNHKMLGMDLHITVS